jgi:hypothetical protein
MFSMLYLGPSQNFGSTSPLLSDTHLGKKLRGCASGEQPGGAAEILTWTEAEHGKRTQLRIRRLSRKCHKRCSLKYADY